MQTIELDLAMRKIVPLLHAKQNDVGKKVAAVLTDNGAAYSIPGDAVFSVWYSGASGEGNYTTIDGRSAFSVSGNTVTVELILQMLQNKGPGQLCLVMNKADGTQLGLWNIPYFVEEIPGAGSQEATAYYTAFLEAAQAMGVAGIESTEHPGCYYRVVNGETEWLNPPMAVGEEYRTAEHYNSKAVYAILFSIGALPNAAKTSLSVANRVDRFVAATLNVTSSDGRYDLVNPSGVSLSFGHNHPGLPNNSSWVDIITNSDFSNYSAWLLTKYTKV